MTGRPTIRPLVPCRATSSRTGNSRLRARHRRFHPWPEPLEGRRLLATIVVNNPTDTPQGGETDLRQAIAAASSGDTITFDANTFASPLTITLNPTYGQLEIGKSLTITGPKEGVTISGGGKSRVFQIDNGVTASLIGLAITDGATSGYGGGVYNAGTAYLTACTISGNSASLGGGLDNDGTAYLTNTTVSGNSATAGGGLYNGGTASLTLTGCTVSGNTASYGGGLENDNKATLTLTGGTVSGNSASYGGGLNNLGTAGLTDSTISENSANAVGGGLLNKKTLYLTSCTVSGNSTNGQGGGLDNYGAAVLKLMACTVSSNYAGSAGGAVQNDGTATLSDSTISNNSSGGSGGGLRNNNTATLSGCTISGNSAGYGGGLNNNDTAALTLTGCTVSGNTAGYGGGLENDGTASLTLTGCTVSGNSAYSDGGGLENDGTASLTLTGCTVSGNTAVDGGGLHDYSSASSTAPLTIGDSIVAGNTATAGPDVSGPVTTDEGYNLIGDTTGSSGFATGNHNLLGTDTHPVDPLLAPLGDYGGPTKTLALLPGSPAIAAGSAGVTGYPSTDQRGEPLDSPTPDIGAFQSQGFTVTVVHGSSPQSTQVNTAFTNPLAVNVAANNPKEPVDGGVITFAAPTSGSSATLSALTAAIGPDGIAQVDATANDAAGTYDVFASARGVATPASFVLTNTGPFSNLAAPTITYGTASVALSGDINAASGSVSITLDRITQTASINADGRFSSVFDTTGLGVAGSPYTVTYAYGTITATTRLTVIPAKLTITADDGSMVYGAPLPGLTASYSGFVGGDSASSLTTRPKLGTTATSTSPPGKYTITVGGAIDPNYSITYVDGTLMIAQDATTTAVSSSSATTSFGQQVTFTATVSANAPGSGTPGGTVDFTDATTHVDLTPTPVSLANGLASLSIATLPVGPQTITATYHGNTDFADSNGAASQSVVVAVYVLNSAPHSPMFGGTAVFAASAQLDIPGPLIVDSPARPSLAVVGSAKVAASYIGVSTGYLERGSATITPTPQTGSRPAADPLADLATPRLSGMASSVNVSSGRLTIKPGIYSAIDVSGTASVTLEPGTYVIAGGGLSVTGSASLSGAGVMIASVGTAYPSAGGTYGGIRLSTTGTVTLSPLTTGAYAGILLDLPAANRSLVFLSAGSSSKLSGIIEAPGSLVVMQGGIQLDAALVVNLLQMGGTTADRGQSGGVGTDAVVAQTGAARFAAVRPPGGVGALGVASSVAALGPNPSDPGPGATGLQGLGATTVAPAVGKRNITPSVPMGRPPAGTGNSGSGVATRALHPGGSRTTTTVADDVAPAGLSRSIAIRTAADASTELPAVQDPVAAEAYPAAVTAPGSARSLDVALEALASEAIAPLAKAVPGPGRGLDVAAAVIDISRPSELWARSGSRDVSTSWPSRLAAVMIGTGWWAWGSRRRPPTSRGRSSVVPRDQR